MTTIQPILVLALSSMLFVASTAGAESIPLADGTVVEGELVAPSTVTIKTAEGERQVAFALLPPQLQKIYWARGSTAASPAAVASHAPAIGSPITDEELASLATEVNLETWAQIAAIGSFRDKPEKRGAGGLVVTKAFNAIDENWVSVYSPKDPVGATGNWNEQVTRARALQERTTQFLHRRWLELFIKAGEAVARRDSNEFAQHVRELKRSRATASAETPRNFFTAK
jgi:hypothetical protein